jgi:sugar phosphate isomerase/epimerase
MNDWAVGLSTGCFYRKSIFEVLPDIARSGISLLEICSYPEHLNYYDTEEVYATARSIEDHGLAVFSFHAPFGLNLDIASPDRKERRRSLVELITAAHAAAALGAKHFVIHPGPEKEGKPLPEERLQLRKNAAESLEILAAECAGKSMRLVLENMLPHLLLGDPADLKWLMEALQPSGPGFCLDTGHAHLGGNLKGLTSLFPDQLIMIHAADNRGTHDDHLPPGQGDIDWHGLITDLGEWNFRGVFILELSGAGGKNPPELLADACQAREFIRKIAGNQPFPGAVWKG